jgi:tRNA (guanosine-2'-O-)-methyltransferase
VFGNEHDGVSEEARNAADGNVIIPQVGMIQSLNISVACAVSLFEAMRQRMVAGMYDTPQYSNDELERRINDWCSR